MRRLKTVVIDGKNVTMNLRQCANKGCLRLFWAMRGSKQSICSELCWQVATQKNWLREDMPPVKKVSKPFQKQFRMFAISPKSVMRPSNHAEQSKKPRKAKSNKRGREVEE